MRRISTLRSLFSLFACCLAAAAMAVGPIAQAEDSVKNRQSTINGLVVRELSNGRHIGFTAAIVATATAEQDGGEVKIRGDIDESMQEALEEAARYVRVQHPKLGNTRFEFSFEERHSPKGGSSAATAFALLLRSMLEGYEFDPKAAITGDIAVNGKVKQIGATVSKIEGAIEDSCTIVAVPADNAPAVSDFFVGIEAKDNFAAVQIFSVQTVDEAADIMRKDRSENLTQAIQIFEKVQKISEKYGTRALGKASTREMIDRVLELAPNHLSAQYASAFAKGLGPTRLTRTASVIEIFNAAEDFWAARERVFNRNIGSKYWTREDLPRDSARQMMKDLKAIQRRTHRDVDGLRVAMYKWIDAIDRVLRARRPIKNSDWAIVDQRAKALGQQLKRLETDEDLVENMLREGY